MNRSVFVRRVTLKLFFKYLVLLILLLLTIFGFLVAVERDKNIKILENDLRKRNYIVKAKLIDNVVANLRWIKFYGDFETYSRLMDESTAKDSDHRRRVVDNLLQSNDSINGITLLDKEGESIREFSKEGKGFSGSMLTHEGREKLLNFRDRTVYIEFKAYSYNRLDMEFYSPILEGERLKGFIGVSYSLDDFFKGFKVEFKDVFDTSHLGIISKGNNSRYSYFSLDNSLDEVRNILSSSHTVAVPFNLGEGLAISLSKYFDRVVLSEEFIGRGRLISYIPDEKIDEFLVLSLKKYLAFSVILLIMTVALLWLYSVEKVERIGTLKTLRRNNGKLGKTLQTKELLFSLIGHDLRSPFTSLLGGFQMLNRRYDRYSREEVKEMIDGMSISCMKLYTLTENLLRWSTLHRKKMEYAPETVKLEEIFQEYQDIFKVQLEGKGIDLELSVEGDGVIHSDRNLLEATIRNLLSNAIKFSKPGGKIRIFTEESEEKLHLSIEDNGVGMPERVKRNLFSGRYNSTLGTLNEKGIGLGLFIVKEFTRLNKGDISFESHQGVGSRFTISLPRLRGVKS